NVGHLHLAEAILDMSEGGPLPTTAILKDVDLVKSGSESLAEFSLNVAMSGDERFDDVGITPKVQWFLRHLEPEPVIKTPARLLYQPLDYDPSVLSGELATLEKELDDELSNFEPPAQQAKEALVTLIYPHRRVGTLPLTSRIINLFPEAPEDHRVRVTLVDSQDGSEFAGWVVREG